MTAELIFLSRVSYRGREVAGPRLRGLLALLADDLRTGCSTARLVDGLWHDEQPENPTKALQVLVSRARSQLGAELIASTATGYRLTLGEDQVDSSAVVLAAGDSSRAVQDGDHTAALAHAEAGLALWDGAADDLAADPVSALRAARVPAYTALVRARALSLARLGRRAEATEALTALVREHPRDEEVLAELLRCEAATVGPAAALARYDTYRRTLREDLGTEPGPALRALHQELLREEAPAVRRGVPHEPNPLLGRAEDIAAVTDLLRTSRVTSIVGAGGLGKTRLAHVVSRTAEQKSVHFVALAGVTTDADVAAEVASALGVSEPRLASAGHLAVSADVLAGIAGALGPAALLVLDNCEHVVRGAADLVQALVSTTRDLRVLTTSRAPLGLSSESVYLLPELSLETTVELFGQRARSARPGVELPTATVEELCRHLDGLPLATELAAARVRVMSVTEIARRLDDRFALLKGGARDAPERHRTLLAVVDWSWNLLDTEGRAALRGLSVFPDGFTAEAARHLVGEGDVLDVLDVLENLVDQSLLKVTDTASGVRFRMLETVREFSAARREEAGGTDRATGQLLEWARDFGRTRHEAVLDAGSVADLDRIRVEQDNLVHALRLAQARADMPTVAAVTAVLAGAWNLESNYARTVTLFEEIGPLLSRFRPGPDDVEVTRTAAVLFTANQFMLHGPRTPAVRSLVTVLRLPPAPPDTLVRAAATVLGALPQALRGDRVALRELCDSHEPLVAGVANAVASFLAENENDPPQALAAARRMLAELDGRGGPWTLTQAHARISELCLQLERGEEALSHIQAALRLQEQLLGPSVDALGVRWAMVLAHLLLGAFDEAEHWLEQTALNQAEDPFGMLMFGYGVRAEILLARGRTEEGLRLWRRAADPGHSPEGPLFEKDPSGVAGVDDVEAWNLEARAVAVIAHAQHGRLDLVEQLAGELPGKLGVLLTHPTVTQPAYVMDLPVCGAFLVALAMVDLERGSTKTAARLFALAERFRYLRGFQPTMSSARVREAAGHADRAAYDDAVSAYAALGRVELRGAALEVLRTRGD
ncbi:ATP-binding protein [Streptomyces sp. NBC_00658]|uniref:ATP-binding protein n=1 Tax=Streptomyces sp. NBC_00658 TaxID=2975800 RepID=UPI0032491489